MQDPKLSVLEQIIAMMNDHMVSGFAPKKVEAEIEMGDVEEQSSPAEKAESEFSREDESQLMDMYQEDEEDEDEGPEIPVSMS